MTERHKRYTVQRLAAIKGLALADIKRVADKAITESVAKGPSSEDRFALEAVRFNAHKALTETEAIVRALAGEEKP